jgi:Domain of unknown function (DUF4421)
MVMFIFYKTKFILTNILFLFLLSSISYAQTDSVYIQSYYKKIVPRVVYNYKRQDIRFSKMLDDTLVSKDAFSTGNQHFFGGDLSYKWATIGYNLSLNPTNSKRNMDFRISTAYRPFQLQFNISYLKNLNYSFLKYDSNGEADTIITSKENNIEITNGKLKLDYVFNYKKYCYSATFSQGGKQLKSKGSFIASSALTQDRIFLSNLSEPVKLKFDSLNAFDNAIITGLDLGLGYGYNWVLKKNWTISILEIPKISFLMVNANQYTNARLNYFTVGFTNHCKAGILYTFNDFFVGSSVYSLVSTSKVKGQFYTNVYTSVNIFAGWIFDTQRISRK